MFLVLLEYVVTLDLVDKSLQDHRDFLDAQYKAGRFIFSGAKVPRTGGVILAKCRDRSELDSILMQDPFFHLGLAKYEIIEFNPTKFAPGLEKVLIP